MKELINKVINNETSELNAYTITQLLEKMKEYIKVNAIPGTSITDVEVVDTTISEREFSFKFKFTMSNGGFILSKLITIPVLKGDKGDTGPQGPKGDKGDTPSLDNYYNKSEVDSRLNEKFNIRDFDSNLMSRQIGVGRPFNFDNWEDIPPGFVSIEIGHFDKPGAPPKDAVYNFGMLLVFQDYNNGRFMMYVPNTDNNNIWFRERWRTNDWAPWKKWGFQNNYRSRAVDPNIAYSMYKTDVLYNRMILNKPLALNSRTPIQVEQDFQKYMISGDIKDLPQEIKHYMEKENNDGNNIINGNAINLINNNV